MTLKKQFISGLLFTAVAKYLAILIQLVVVGVLSRILNPFEFGLVAIISVFVVFFGLIADMGIAPAIIQNQTLTARDLDSIFSFTIITGFFLCILFYFAAPLFVHYYEQEALLPLFQMMSLAVLFSTINIVPNALLLKNKLFKFIMIRQLIVQIASGLLGIFLATAGYGVYALIVMSISTSATTFIFNISRFPLKIRFPEIYRLNKIANFSVYQFAFNFINYFSRNSDKLLIGKYLTPETLGFYEKSYRLMLLPVENLTHVLTPVMQPVLQDLGNDTGRLSNAYSKIFRLLALIGFPLSVFLYFSAGELVLLVFGNQWTESIPVFKILAITVGIQIVLSSSGSIFQVANRTDLLFLSGLLSAITMVGGICTGIFILKSAEGVAYCLLIAFSINFIQGFYILIKHALRQSFLRFFRFLVAPILISFVCFMVFILFTNFIHLDINLIILLVLKVLVFCSVFLLQAYASGEIKDILELLKFKRGVNSK